jgi:hypothetical protein
MGVVDIIFVCFIGSGLALTLITVRQRKANKYLRDLSSATKIHTENEYSEIGIAIRAGEYLVKCPDCAEFIKLEANICKNCHRDVTAFTEGKRVEQSRISELNTLARQNQAAKDKSKAKLIVLVVFTLLGSFLLINFISSSISSNNQKSAAESRLSAIDSEYTKWQSATAGCNYDFAIQKNENVENPMGTLSIGFSSDETEILNLWSTDKGRALDCVSSEILGFKLSTYFTVEEKDTLNFVDRYLYDKEYTDASFKGIVGSKNGFYNGEIFQTEAAFGDGLVYFIALNWDYPSL